MLSHDLARALLDRRNNDVRIEVLVDDDPAGVRDLLVRRVELRDLPDGSRHRTDEVVVYDTDDDVVVIRAAYVVVGGPPDD
jgi:hypothetical protein